MVVTPTDELEVPAGPYEGDKAMNLYHLAHGDFSADGDYIITKLTEDLIPEGSYRLSLRECTCPAGHRPTCRHRQMLPLFLEKGHVADGYLLDWHTRQFVPPQTF